MKSFCNYLSYGYIVKKESEDFVEFRVSNFTDIESVIIPFFWKIPSLCRVFVGDKRLDFESFKDVVQVISTKGHLTVV